MNITYNHEKLFALHWNKYDQSYINKIIDLTQISKLRGSSIKKKNYFLPTKTNFCYRNRTKAQILSETH